MLRKPRVEILESDDGAVEALTLSRKKDILLVSRILRHIMAINADYEDGDRARTIHTQIFNPDNQPSPTDSLALLGKVPSQVEIPLDAVDYMVGSLTALSSSRAQGLGAALVSVCVPQR